MVIMGYIMPDVVVFLRKASDYFKLSVGKAASMKSSCSLFISVILCWKNKDGVSVKVLSLKKPEFMMEKRNGECNTGSS